MHMADALVSPPIAAAAGVIALTLIVTASKEISRNKREGMIPLMGIMGAFVFAAQMINFTIPGTGSSGHIIGGVLLGALLGPWCAFLTLCSVLIVQCLVFADGGLMALGCNIINMAAMSCLVAYPLVYRPLVHVNASNARIMWVSILACVVGLECGALLVTVETVASQITALPFGEFLLFMLPIHLVIGICEGIATGLVIMVIKHGNPALLQYDDDREVDPSLRYRRRMTLIAFGAAAIAMGIAFAWIASTNPDGLEWSIMKITGSPELQEAINPPTAIMPDYNSHIAGVVGGVIVMAMVWAISTLLFRKKKHKLA